MEINYIRLGGVRATGISEYGVTLSLPYHSIARYNYGIDCLRTPFEGNKFDQFFKGKFLPIRTKSQSYACTCVGFIYLLLEYLLDFWLFLIYQIGLGLVACKDKIRSHNTCTDFTFDSQEDYNRAVKQWRLLAAGTAVINLLMVLLYVYFIYIIIKNCSHTRLLYFFSQNVSDLGNFSNTFVKITTENYYELTGVRAEQNFISLYGINMKFPDEIHFLLYTTCWWFKVFFRSIVLIILFGIGYAVILYYSVVVILNLTQFTITPTNAPTNAPTKFPFTMM